MKTDKEEFNERMHAFISAAFYKELTGRFGKRGKEAFILAVRLYGEQRGRRMAQRAVRDGRELDFAAYRDYSEWAPTAAMEERGWSGISTAEKRQEDLVLSITRCPWHLQFREMGLTEAGEVYCAHLDKAICRGFNPELVFDVEQTLNTADYCIQILRGACAKADNVADSGNKADRVRSFEYHCAHIYYALSMVTEAVFSDEGRECCRTVLEAFAGEFGEETAGIMTGYTGTDFNVC